MAFVPLEHHFVEALVIYDDLSECTVAWVDSPLASVLEWDSFLLGSMRHNYLNV